ncbi:MAG: heme-binding beta-barrel domain-containing protein [Paracoccus sp. (in: a-proteobacteria)]|uniref:heme-binding beta-barrel domain-containing protein n=1 Tax=Paracoccus sp. TaxID=267 RepID=UPI0026DEB6C7|nr:heme-binding beta-barrel domain-containing protein [Paracoccus sp. (in: a-proteobacteria)]MDO5631709.1 heme-binding beta-barrel domain-containing protein [Paracoccus sp. (in: a-proteobacteria)]
MRLPTDIFTEPDASPDTLANLGPLRPLAGTWQTATGQDTSPKADGPQQKPYTETITMQPIDPQTNGPQLFYGLRYHIHITTPGEAATFHDQVGYWLWEPATGLILQTLAIPRGQSLLAAGKAAADARSFAVEARRGEVTYGITTNEYLDQAFRTERYRIAITCHDDASWSYQIETDLIVQGKPFNHHDTNRLYRIAPPQPNPMMLNAGQG